MSILSDEFYYQPVQIDTINARVYVDLVAKEGDVNGRGLLVTLTENGLTKDTTGIALNLKWEHTSVGNQGLDNFESVDLSKGLYKITYPSEMLNRGTVRASIQISDSGKFAGIRNIIITVDSGVGDDNVIVSSDSFTALTQALIDVNNLEKTFAPRMLSLESQLAQKANQSFVDSQFSSIVSGAPKGTYTNLAALSAAYPTGADGVFLTLSDGHWHYWNDTTKTWTDGGIYQAGSGDWLVAMTEDNQKWEVL